MAIGWPPDRRDGLRLWGADASGAAPTPEIPSAGPVPTPIPLSPNAITAANAGQVTQTGLWQAQNNNGESGLGAVRRLAGLLFSPVRIYDVATGQTHSVDSNHAQVLLQRLRRRGCPPQTR